MTDDERIARLTALARTAYPLRVGLCVYWNAHAAWVVEEPSGEHLIDIHGVRALDALEAALLVLAEPLYKPGAAPGRGPEMLRLHIAYERGLKRIAELEAILAQITETVCYWGQFDDRIDEIRLLLVGRCSVCGEPASLKRDGVLLCHLHASEET